MWWLYAHVQTQVRLDSQFVCVLKASGVYPGMLIVRTKDLVRNDWTGFFHN